MLLKKLVVIGAGMLLTLGVTTSSEAVRAWNTRHVSTVCSHGVCHKYLIVSHWRCVGGRCHVWHERLHWNWR